MKIKTKLLTAAVSAAAVFCVATAAVSAQGYYTNNNQPRFSFGTGAKFYIRDNKHFTNIDLLDISVESGNYNWLGNKTYAKAYAKPAVAKFGARFKTYATYKESAAGRGYSYNSDFSDRDVHWTPTTTGYTTLFSNDVGGTSYESRVLFELNQLLQTDNKGKVIGSIPINTSVTCIFS